MTITVVSDIHLEFGRDVELPGGDILLLAGDILTAEAKDADFDWLKRQCGRYQHALMCDGNHTFYHGDIDLTTRWISEQIMERDIRNLAYGDTGGLTIDGVKYVWATLWTDFCSGNGTQWGSPNIA